MSTCLACRLARSARPPKFPPSSTFDGGRRGAKMWVKAQKRKKVEAEDAASLTETIRMFQALAPLRSDLAIKLSIEPALHKSVNLNSLKGRIFLPFSVESAGQDGGGGKAKETIAVVVDPDGEAGREAQRAGADFVGGSELVQQILDGLVNPTKILCHPDQLPLLTRNPLVARTLGPRGLMPSVRRGTVSSSIASMIRDARGALDWSADGTGMVKTVVGRTGMKGDEVEANVVALVGTVAEQAQGREKKDKDLSSPVEPAKEDKETEEAKKALLRRQGLKRGGIKQITISSGDGVQFLVL